MHNFKPGDLALIVGAYNVPQNIGKTVVLEEFLLVGQISIWRDPADGCAIQNAADSPGWLVLGDEVKSQCGFDGWVISHPAHLMPLRGDEQTARAKREELTV